MKITKLILSLVFIWPSFFIHGASPGTFEQVTGSPFSAQNGPASSSYSPVVSGNVFSATPNYNSNTVSVYQVDETGAFTEVSGSPFATGGLPAWQAFSPLVSNHLFSAVANFNDNTVSVYAVNQMSGAFTEVLGSPFAAGAGPSSIEFSPVVSGNLFAAVPNTGANTVSVYSVNQNTGAFTEVAGSPFATGLEPNFAVFSPLVAGNLFAAVVNANGNTISVYNVNQTTGAFTPVAGSPFAAGSKPLNLAFSLTGSGNLFAAVVNVNDNTLSIYNVNQTTGAFTEVPSSPMLAGSGPNVIAFSPLVLGDLFAAVVNFNTNNVSVYSVNQSSGSFTEIAGSPFATGSEPSGIAFSPLVSGNLFATVANFGDATVSVYQVVTPPPPAPLPPSHFVGVIKKNKFATQTEAFLRVSFVPSQTPDVIAYRIYRNNRLVTTIASTSPLMAIFRNCSPNGYEIAAVNINNIESIRIPLIIE